MFVFDRACSLLHVVVVFLSLRFGKDYLVHGNAYRLRSAEHSVNLWVIDLIKK